MKITFAGASASDTRLIALIVNQGSMPDGLEAELAEGAKAARFKGKPGQVFEGFAHRDGKLARIALAGAGEAGSSARHANLEKAGAAIAAKFGASGEASVTVDFAGSGLSGEEAAAVLLGLRLRMWRHDVYRTTLADEKKLTLTSATAINAPDGAEAAWTRQSALSEGVEFTRTLVAEPANVVYPISFVERCQGKFAGTGAELTVLDETAMEKLGMGALLGVGQGSEQPSRLLAIRWNGGEAGEEPTVFVGKGVTFDTGGISLKPPGGMEDMKWDMGGAGAVAGAMLALVKRKAKALLLYVL